MLPSKTVCIRSTGSSPVRYPISTWTSEIYWRVTLGPMSRVPPPGPG
ncbi:hypothetical protein ACFFX0_19595 [Citricoccus parietis]|uniref:Uncharacterized protein n=1 Tax=Citricoccus parietis TaxID=592307 RepID=A0ABV5G2X5_9MICC